jgi:hypothetical protein
MTGPACAFEFVPLLRRRVHRLNARGARPDGQAPPVHHEFERDVVAFAVAQDGVDGVLTLSQAPEPFTHLPYLPYCGAWIVFPSGSKNLMSLNPAS